MHEHSLYEGLIRYALSGWTQERLDLALDTTMLGIATTLLGMVSPQATAFLVDKAIHDTDGGNGTGTDCDRNWLYPVPNDSGVCIR